MKTVRRRLADGTIKEYRYDEKAPRILPGSFGALTLEYRKSPDFLSLAPRTRAGYLKYMGAMHKLYNVALVDIRRRHAIRYRDHFRKTPAKANKVVSMLSVLLEYAVELEYIPSNPIRRVPLLAVGEYRRWSDDDIAFAFERFPETMRRAIIVALYTGQRQGDVLAMRWSDYDGEGIQVTQQKTGVKLWIPCSAVLRAELEAWKAAGRSSVTIITNVAGRPYRGYSFGAMFSKEISKHPEMRGLVFHGLRKTAAAKLAEAGCTVHEIAAITGHKTLSMLTHYTKEAEQKTRARAAVIKLENVTGPKYKRDASH